MLHIPACRHLLLSLLQQNWFALSLRETPFLCHSQLMAPLIIYQNFSPSNRTSFAKQTLDKTMTPFMATKVWCHLYPQSFYQYIWWGTLFIYEHFFERYLNAIIIRWCRAILIRQKSLDDTTDDDGEDRVNTTYYRLLRCRFIIVSVLTQSCFIRQNTNNSYIWTDFGVMYGQGVCSIRYAKRWG